MNNGIWIQGASLQTLQACPLRQIHGLPFNKTGSFSRLPKRFLPGWVKQINHDNPNRERRQAPNKGVKIGKAYRYILEMVMKPASS